MRRLVQWSNLKAYIKKLFLVLLSTFNAHLSIVRIKISALAKIKFVGSSADSTLLKHAYTMHPYCNTLETSALTTCSFTLILEIPIILQLVLMAWKVLYALLILAYSIHSGLLLLFSKIRQRYLNFFTTVMF